MNTKEIYPFPCKACGKCCRKVSLSPHTRFLDRGDGICQNLNTQTNLCKIYPNRPLVCRVNDYYLEYLSDKYSWDDFVKMNKNICDKL